MASYWIMLPPPSAASAPDAARIVRDGFAVLGFLVPPLWLLWHRLWIEAALVFAVALGLTALGEATGIGWLASALSLLLSVFVGLEGQALRVAALRRRGWRECGIVEASSQDEAEIRYAAGIEERDDGLAASTTLVLPWSTPRQSGPALGLLSYPGRA